MKFNATVNKIAIHLPLKYQKVLFEEPILTRGFNKNGRVINELKT